MVSPLVNHQAGSGHATSAAELATGHPVASCEVFSQLTAGFLRLASLPLVALALPQLPVGGSTAICPAR